MAKKKTQSAPATRTVSCKMCNHPNEVPYNSHGYEIEHDKCVRCETIRQAHPDIHKWVMDIMAANKSPSEDEIRDMISASGSDYGYSYY